MTTDDAPLSEEYPLALEYLRYFPEIDKSFKALAKTVSDSADCYDTEVWEIFNELEIECNIPNSRLCSLLLLFQQVDSRLNKSARQQQQSDRRPRYSSLPDR